MQDAPGGDGAVVAAQHVGQAPRRLLQHAWPAARCALQRLLRRLRALACPAGLGFKRVQAAGAMRIAI